LKRFVVHARQLYEQGAKYNRLRQYVAHWVKYIHAGLNGLVSRKGGSKRYLVFIVKKLGLVNQLIEQSRSLWARTCNECDGVKYSLQVIWYRRQIPATCVNILRSYARRPSAYTIN